VEAKLLQTAASLRTFFLLVISAEALECSSRFCGIGLGQNPSTFDLSHVSADPRCRGDPLQAPVVRPIAPSVVLILVPPDKNSYAPTMLDWNQCPTVERVPGKVSGVWLFKGTRVPVKALFENLEDGAGVDDFLRWFPGVKREQVLAVLEFAEQSLTVA
jgi:uncharacterized protein (DUF433 family)